MCPSLFYPGTRGYSGGYAPGKSRKEVRATQESKQRTAVDPAVVVQAIQEHLAGESIRAVSRRHGLNTVVVRYALLGYRLATRGWPGWVVVIAFAGGVLVGWSLGWWWTTETW